MDFQAIPLKEPGATFQYFAKFAKENNSNLKNCQEWLFCKLGLTTQNGEGLAALLFGEGACKKNNHDFWFCASPVSLKPMKDDLKLTLVDDLSNEESHKLFSIVRNHLAKDNIDVRYHSSSIWGINAQRNQKVATKKVTDVSNKTIGKFIINGQDSHRWKRLISELEILLNQHPVNISRIKKAKNPVNSVWMWGQGGTSSSSKKKQALITQNRVLRGIASKQNLPIFSKFNEMSKMAVRTKYDDIFYTLDDFNKLEECHDGEKYSRHFNEAMRMLLKKRIDGINFVYGTSANVRELHIDRLSRLKFWKYFI